MIGNVFNSHDVRLSSGYTQIEDWLSPQEAIPFKINTQIDLALNTEIRHYFDINDSFKNDIYPWFTTCK